MSAWINKTNNGMRGATVIALAASLSVSMLSLTGCGGSSSSNNGGTLLSPVADTAQTAAPRAAGRVQLAVKWPERADEVRRGRYVPTYAGSLRFTLIGITEPSRRYETFVTRPSNPSGVQTVAFPDRIITGRYRLVGEAFVGSEPSGSPVAVAAQEIQVSADATTDARLTLASTLARLEFLGTDLRTPVNVSVALQVRAAAADGTTLFIPAGANGLIFSLVSGGDTTGATLSESGLLLAPRAGAVRVRVAETVAGVSAEADVTVTAGNTGTNNGLAQNAFPKPGGDARNSGQGNGPAAPAIGDQTWSFSDGSAAFTEMPIAAPDGSVYAVGHVGLNAFLHALRADGTKRWSAAIGNGVGVTAPALAANGTVYLGNDTEVVAINGADGALLWRQRIPFFAQVGLNIGQNGLVYVAGQASQRGGVVALDGVTGAVRWHRELPTQANVCPALSPDGNTLYVPTVGGTLYALDSVSGADRWTFSAESGAQLRASAVVGPDGTVYLPEALSFDTTSGTGQPSQVYALDGASGAVRWKRRFPEPFGGEDRVAVSGTNSAVYVVSRSESEDAGVYALNPSDGGVIWRNANMGRSQGNQAPSHLTLGGGGTVYHVGNTDGGSYFGVSALDPQNGSRLWTFLPDDGDPEGAAVVSPNGLILFRSRSFFNGYSIRALR